MFRLGSNYGNYQPATVFHISSGSLLISVKPTTKYGFPASMMILYVFKVITLTKCILLEDLLLHDIQKPFIKPFQCHLHLRGSHHFHVGIFNIRKLEMQVWGDFNPHQILWKSPTCSVGT
jgi:hypothetical protein